MISLINEQSVYWILFITSFIEGFNINIFAGFLYNQAYINPLRALVVLIFGNWFSDLMWYYFGYKKGIKFLWLFRKYFPPLRFVLKVEYIDWFLSAFKKYDYHSIIISKLLIGPGITTQIAAGIAKVRLPRYFLFSFVANLLFSLILFSIGYLIGESYKQASVYIQGFSFLIFAVVFVYLIEFIFRRTVKKNITKFNKK